MNHTAATTLLPAYSAPLAHTATGVPSFIPDDTIIATVTHVFITRGTHYAMETHSLMPDRTHNITADSLTVFYGNPCVFVVISCVLQHFIATGVPSFIPDDTIIAMESHYYMPEITQNATVALCYMPENTQLTLTVLGVLFTVQGVSLTDNPCILA